MKWCAFDYTICSHAEGDERGQIKTEEFEVGKMIRAGSDGFGVLIGLLLAFAVVSVHGQVVTEDVKFVASSGNTGGKLGVSVAISDGSLFSGSAIGPVSPVFAFDTINTNQVSSYVPESVITSFYGWAVSVDQGVLAVGAYGSDFGQNESGRVYLYDSATKNQFAVLGGGFANTAFFGASVAMSDGKLVVGAYSDRVAGVGSGSVIRYNAKTGALFPGIKLFPSDRAENDLFGISVAIENEIIVIGATGDDDNGNGSGSVYVYNYSTGEQLAKLHPEDAEAGDNFGFSVSISDGYIVVGSRSANGNGVRSGAAYVFDAQSFLQVAKLIPNDGELDDLFGGRVAISDGLVVIGATGNDELGESSGAAYVYSASSGNQLMKLLPSDGKAGGQFGSSIAIQNGLIAVGASGLNAVYGYEYNYDCDGDGVQDHLEILLNQSLDCNFNDVLDSCEIANEPSLDCNSNGVIDSCEIAILSNIDIVVLFDTSGSMDDDAAALCSSVSTIESDLSTIGFDPVVTVLGITDAPGGSYSCLSGSVSGMFGSAVPGGGSLNSSEDWGDAAAVVAENYPWRGNNRIIVVISDEAPQDGDPCDSADQSSIDNAVLWSTHNGVRVVSVSAQGSTECVDEMMQSLATRTGGSWFASTDPNTDLVVGVLRAIQQLAENADCNNNDVLDSCEIADGLESDCNNNGILDSCELLVSSVLDCDANGVLDECQVPGIVGDSGLQGPIGFGSPTTVTLSNPPNASTDVSVRVTLSGDFSAATQIALFKVNGQQLDVNLLPNAEPFFAGADVIFDCPDAPAVFEFEIPASLYNASLSGGSASFEVFAPSPAVSIDDCPAGVSRIEVQYYYEDAPDDCNGNGRPDLCDLIIFGGDSADDNFNFIPDECEAVECIADLNNDGALDFFDVSAFLTAFGSGNPIADFTGDGLFDFFDVSTFLQEFSAGCP